MIHMQSSDIDLGHDNTLFTCCFCNLKTVSGNCGFTSQYLDNPILESNRHIDKYKIACSDCFGDMNNPCYQCGSESKRKDWWSKSDDHHIYKCPQCHFVVGKFPIDRSNTTV